MQVVPPKGWAPRRRSPDLSKIRINTPIKQHVFGKSGSYVCILEEQRVRGREDGAALMVQPCACACALLLAASAAGTRLLLLSRPLHGSALHAAP